MKTLRFDAAQMCAASADRAVLGALPPILNSQESGAPLDGVVDTIHVLIAPPTPSHPFRKALEPFRQRAKALMDGKPSGPERR